METRIPIDKSTRIASLLEAGQVLLSVVSPLTGRGSMHSLIARQLLVLAISAIVLFGTGFMWVGVRGTYSGGVGHGERWPPG